MTTPTYVASSRAETALRQSSIPSLRRLCVEETDSAVVIAGEVPSYYLKQLAQETIMPVLGHRELINSISVVQDRGGS